MRNQFATRATVIGLVVSWAVLIVAVAWIFKLNVDVRDQQHRTDRIVAQQAQMVTVLCRFATGFILNQPDIDSHLLYLLQGITNGLPARCFP